MCPLFYVLYQVSYLFQVTAACTWFSVIVTLAGWFSTTYTTSGLSVMTGAFLKYGPARQYYKVTFLPIIRIFLFPYSHLKFVVVLIVCEIRPKDLSKLFYFGFNAHNIKCNTNQHISKMLFKKRG